MIRILCILFVVLALFSAVAVGAQPPAKQTAIIHFEGLRELQIEGNATDIRLIPVIGKNQQTTYFKLRNLRGVPRNINLCILDLTEPTYDLYIDGKFIGVKTKETLETGVPLQLPGSDIPRAQRDYFSRLTEACRAVWPRYEGVDDDNARPAFAILTAMAKRAGEIRAMDDTARTVSIVVVPEGKPLNLPGVGIQSRPDSGDAARVFAAAISKARLDATSRIRDPLVHSDVIAAFTPINLRIVAIDSKEPGGNTAVTVRLTNWTDRPITGKITLVVPSGWNVIEISPQIYNSGYAQVAAAKFEVTRPADAGPATISAVADLTVDRVSYRTVAKLSK